MWVFDTETLRFLQVNEAATKQLRLQRRRISALGVRDIRPDGNETSFSEHVAEWRQMVATKAIGATRINPERVLKWM
jgi:hypothetical protein